MYWILPINQVWVFCTFLYIVGTFVHFVRCTLYIFRTWTYIFVHTCTFTYTYNKTVQSKPEKISLIAIMRIFWARKFRRCWLGKFITLWQKLLLMRKRINLMPSTNRPVPQRRTCFIILWRFSKSVIILELSGKRFDFWVLFSFFFMFPTLHKRTITTGHGNHSPAVDFFCFARFERFLWTDWSGNDFFWLLGRSHDAVNELCWWLCPGAFGCNVCW